MNQGRDDHFTERVWRGHAPIPKHSLKAERMGVPAYRQRGVGKLHKGQQWASAHG
jgi:hypothetical protein